MQSDACRSQAMASVVFWGQGDLNEDSQHSSLWSESGLGWPGLSFQGKPAGSIMSAGDGHGQSCWASLGVELGC